MEMIILIGLPASGKSSFFRGTLAKSHALISKDAMKNVREKEVRQKKLIEEAFREGRSVVVDNTSPDLKCRAALIALGKEYGAKITGYFFECDVKRSLEKNKGRDDHTRVPEVAIHSAAKKMVRPAYSEGFDELYAVRMIGKPSSHMFRIEPWSENPAPPAHQLKTEQEVIQEEEKEKT